MHITLLQNRREIGLYMLLQISEIVFIDLR